MLILQLPVWKAGNIRPPVAGDGGDVPEKGSLHFCNVLWPLNHVLLVPARDQRADILLFSSNKFYAPLKMEKEKPQYVSKQQKEKLQKKIIYFNKL